MSSTCRAPMSHAAPQSFCRSCCEYCHPLGNVSLTMLQILFVSAACVTDALGRSPASENEIHRSITKYIQDFIVLLDGRPLILVTSPMFVDHDHDHVSAQVAHSICTSVAQSTCAQDQHKVVYLADVSQYLEHASKLHARGRAFFMDGEFDA